MKRAGALLLITLLIVSCSKENNPTSGQDPIQTEGLTNINASLFGFNFEHERQIELYQYDPINHLWNSYPDSINLIFFTSLSSPPDIAANPILESYANLSVDFSSGNVSLMDNGTIITLDDTLDAPNGGYSAKIDDIALNEIYALQLKDSTYAILQILELDNFNVKFRWKYRPDGGKTFE